MPQRVQLREPELSRSLSGMTGDLQSDSGAPPESLLDQRGRPPVLKRSVDLEDWAGGIIQEHARVPAIRINRRWVNTLWLIPIGVAGLVVAIALAQQLRQYGWMQNFIETYPGTSTAYAPPVASGFPAWLRWQHLFNIIFMMFIIRAGMQILADHPRLYLNSGCRPGTEWFRMRDPVPADRMDQEDAARVWTAKDDAVALPKWLGIPGIRHTIGLARWWHFSFDLLWLVNGLVFYVLLFATGQWRRIVPRSWDVFPNALSTAVQYASLDFPSNAGFTNYNGMQIIAYFTTVFVAAPLAFLTGLLQAPAIAAIVGTRHCSSAPSTRSIRASYSSASCAVLKARNCEMSVPDANAFSPVPVRIIALIERSPFTVSQIAAICSYIAKVSALRACGRLKVIRAMPPSIR